MIKSFYWDLDIKNSKAASRKGSPQHFFVQTLHAPSLSLKENQKLILTRDITSWPQCQQQQL